MGNIRAKSIFFLFGAILVIANASFVAFAQARLSFATENLGGQEVNHLVISEVQIAGVTASDEFVELFNPTGSAIDLEALPLKLHIRNSSGTNFHKTLTLVNKIIPSRGYFLIAPAGYTGTVQADATYSTSSGPLVSSGAVYISTSPTKETGIIDRMGWAFQPPAGCEVACASYSYDPAAFNSLQRKPGGTAGNGQDTDNNENDFLEPNLSSPQNSQSAVIPVTPPANIDTTAPDEATSFTATPSDGQVVLVWVLSTSADLKGSKLYINPGTGFGAGVDMGKSVSSTQTNLTNGTSYTFKLTSYDETGNESAGITVSATPAVTATPTPPPATPETPPLQGGEGGGSSAPAPPPNVPGMIVINELMIDPNEGDAEWVELLNKSGRTLDLAGWMLEEGSQSKTTISGDLVAGGFFVIEAPKGNLNNKGDQVFLKDPQGQMIDQMTYGLFDDGEVQNNAPAARDGKTLVRIPDGADSGSDITDFQVTSSATKAALNVLVTQSSEGDITVASFATTVVLNELLPNPQGDDSVGEFIELKNIGTTPVDIVGWKLSNRSGARSTMNAKDMPTTTIAAGGFLVIPRSVSRVSLRNGGDAISLVHPNDFITSSVEYSEASEGLAYARDSQGLWQWTSTITRGGENVITVKNRLPHASLDISNRSRDESGEGVQFFVGDRISFDASDSYDPNGDVLSFAFELPGKISNRSTLEETFEQQGLYPVVLTVRDGKGGADTIRRSVEVREDLRGESISMYNRTTVSSSPPIPYARLGLMLNELLPNPQGSDDSEWIELYHSGDEEVNLKGWSLDDAAQGSKAYAIADDLFINPGEYVVLPRSRTKVVLNNEGDEVVLRAPDGGSISSIHYERAKEGLSFMRSDDGSWVFTTSSTPGARNVFEVPRKEIKRAQPALSAVASAKAEGGGEGVPQRSVVVEVPLAKARELPAKTIVQTRGIVAVEPGLLGKNTFYLAGSGIKVVMRKAATQSLRVGDAVSLTAVRDDVGGEPRLVVAKKDDLKVEEIDTPPAPHQTTLSDIAPDMVGTLVQVQGHVAARKGSTFTLQENDTQVKVAVLTSTGIELPVLVPGAKVRVNGIVSTTKTGLRLLPRYAADIEVLEQGASIETAVNAGRDQSATLFTLLWISFILTGLVLLGLVLQHRAMLAPWLVREIKKGLKKERGNW